VADGPPGPFVATGTQPDSISEGINMSDKSKEMASKVLAFVEANPHVLLMDAWITGLSNDARILPDAPVPDGVTMCLGVLAAHLDGYTIFFDEEEGEFKAARSDTSFAEGFSSAGKIALDITGGWWGAVPYLFATDQESALQVLSALAAGVEYSDTVARQVEAAECAPVRTADDA